MIESNSINLNSPPFLPFYHPATFDIPRRWPTVQDKHPLLHSGSHTRATGQRSQSAQWKVGPRTVPHSLVLRIRRRELMIMCHCARRPWATPELALTQDGLFLPTLTYRCGCAEGVVAQFIRGRAPFFFRIPKIRRSLRLPRSHATVPV